MKQFECLNCEKPIDEDIDLCDDCFEVMPMNEWNIPGTWKVKEN